MVFASPRLRRSAPVRRRRLFAEQLENRRLLATIVVDTWADSTPEPNDGILSLREAITQSNASVGVRDTIAFNIPRLPLSGVSHWSAEESANDIVGPNSGTLQNGATFGPGLIGQGFRFDGVDDQVTVPHDASQNPGQITIAGWINPTSGGNGLPILQKQSTPNAGAFTFETTNSGSANGLKFTIWIGGTAHTLSAGQITIGAWQHVAATFDGAFMKIYVNGVQQGTSVAASGAIDASIAPLVMGRNAVTPANAFAGTIDELELYRRALVATEVRALFRVGAPFPLLNVPQEMGLFRAEGNANDSAGASDGTLQGDATFAPGAVGKAFRLDGSGDYIYLGTPASLQLQSFSIVGSLQRTSATQRR